MSHGGKSADRLASGLWSVAPLIHSLDILVSIVTVTSRQSLYVAAFEKSDDD